jgi:mannonate dehydratase
MIKTWRWFGKNDRIALSLLRQIGVEGIVTALHDIPNGEVWELNRILDLKRYIEDAGLYWAVVESLPVSEAIKYAGSERDALIDNYIRSLENLGKAGIKTVCYNFMPVIDWIRTDLMRKMPDGSYSLYFDKIRFAYFDCHILEREGAEKDYTPEEREKIRAFARTVTEAEKDALVDTIIVKTQGFINGNVREGEKNPVALFKKLLSMYEGTDRTVLRNNLKYFLERIMPVCDRYGVSMAVHPDDPPCQTLGLPRIVTSAEDMEQILKAVDNIHNGITFCAGSLSAGIHNELPEMAERFASRTKFVHLRSVDVEPDGSFIEASHLAGRGQLIKLIRIFERENPALPMRVDHGKLMSDDADKGYNPGYSFLGRMFALAQMDGVMATVRNEMKENLQKIY